MNKQENWDAIVIGSGIGGLALANLLARSNKMRVLVLEQHSKVGGLTHEFSRRSKYTFDVGVHFVGSMNEGNYLRKLFDYLTDNKLAWQKLPDCLDRIYFPEMRFDVPSQLADFKSWLCMKFPEQQKSIDLYFATVNACNWAYCFWQLIECFPKFMGWPLRAFLRWRWPKMFQTTDVVLRDLFSDNSLIALLTGHWGSYGLPPTQSSFGFYAVHMSHYFNGGWYPVGGGAEIAKRLTPAITAHGGQIRTSYMVTGLNFDDEVLSGVSAEDKQGNTYHFNSPLVISNAGARSTYQKIIGDEFLQSSSDYIKDGPSAVTIYLALVKDPKTFGFTSANYWLNTDFHHRLPILSDGQLDIQHLYLSFPSLKRSEDHYTAEIIVPVDPSLFTNWANSHWQKRPQQYLELKQAFYQQAMWIIDEQFPDFSQNILFHEISTPLSVKHFQRHPAGSIYGIPADPERFYSRWSRARTPIKNFYMVGSDTFGSGIGGALTSAMKSFEIINNPHGSWATYGKLSEMTQNIKDSI